MVSAAAIMRPLPVQPIDSRQTPGAPTPLPRRGTDRVMFPLPVSGPLEAATAGRTYVTSMSKLPPYITPTF
ncbi:MAG: hypothetical protein JWM25_1618 [Thermoleophilia bacterium]|nr:hypothetical protein [Thermoleophilia bacterium]